MSLQNGTVGKDTYCQSNPNNLSSIPGIHMAEKKDSNKKSSDFHTCTVAHKINI